MDFHGYPWTSMDIHGLPWTSMDIHGLLWISMDLHAYPWISMDIHGLPWISMEVHGLRKSTNIYRKSIEPPSDENLSIDLSIDLSRFRLICQKFQIYRLHPISNPNLFSLEASGGHLHGRRSRHNTPSAVMLPSLSRTTVRGCMILLSPPEQISIWS